MDQYRPENKPPYSEDAEMSVLGAMLMDEGALHKGLEFLKDDDFYLPIHRIIFRAIQKLFDEKKVVDLLTVKDYLERSGDLGKIGGASYLGSLIESVITPALIERHSQIIVEKSIYRKVIATLTKVLESTYRQELSADELLDLAEHEIFSIRERRIRRGFISMKDLVAPVFQLIDQRMQHQRDVTGIPTGIRELDVTTSGFQPGDLVVLASRPSMGKTSFALNVMNYLSVYLKIPTAIFSLEMSKEQLVQRMLCLESRVPIRKVRTGKISKEDIPRLTHAAYKLGQAPIYVDDTPAIPLLELRAKARRIKREANVKFLIVDYLQLIQGPKDSENRQQEISAISRSLKALAKELEIPILAVSQLSRAVEHRTDKRPQLADLRESGAIEQDADTVIFIFREELYDPRPDNRNYAELIISKQRNGPIGKVPAVFLKEITRFENYAEETLITEEEIPTE